MTTNWENEKIAEMKAMIGDVDDSKLAAILELDPSLEEVEEAVLKVQGLDGPRGHDEWPLKGKAGLIFDLLSAELNDESHSH